MEFKTLQISLGKNMSLLVREKKPYPSYSTRIYWAIHANQLYYLLRKAKRKHLNSS